MSRVRKLLVVLLAITSPLAAAAGMLAPAVMIGEGDHGHVESLVLEDGELHVVLHHHDELARTDSGASFEAADHDVPLVEHSVATAIAKPRSDRTTLAVMDRVASISAPISATLAPVRANEAPPPLVLSSACVLRI